MIRQYSVYCVFGKWTRNHACVFQWLHYIGMNWKSNRSTEVKVSTTLRKLKLFFDGLLPKPRQNSRHSSICSLD